MCTITDSEKIDLKIDSKSKENPQDTDSISYGTNASNEKEEELKEGLRLPSDFLINEQDLLNGEDLSFKEVTSEVVSSTSVLGKRVLRQYSSEFVLPDETRISISRKEITFPSDGLHQVFVSIASGLPDPKDPLIAQYQRYCHMPTDSLFATSETCTSNSEVEYSSEGDNFKKGYSSAYRGLRISEYIDDDPWAASMLECDSNAEGHLLRQLEAGYCLNPNAYHMERVQTHRNVKTVIDVKTPAQIRTIGLSRTHSEADSINTETTEVLEAETQ